MNGRILSHDVRTAGMLELVLVLVLVLCTSAFGSAADSLQDLQPGRHQGIHTPRHASDLPQTGGSPVGSEILGALEPVRKSLGSGKPSGATSRGLGESGSEQPPFRRLALGSDVSSPLFYFNGVPSISTSVSLTTADLVGVEGIEGVDYKHVGVATVFDAGVAVDVVLKSSDSPDTNITIPVDFTENDRGYFAAMYPQNSVSIKGNVLRFNDASLPATEPHVFMINMVPTGTYQLIITAPDGSNGILKSSLSFDETAVVSVSSTYVVGDLKLVASGSTVLDSVPVSFEDGKLYLIAVVGLVGNIAYQPSLSVHTLELTNAAITPAGQPLMMFLAVLAASVGLLKHPL